MEKLDKKCVRLFVDNKHWKNCFLFLLWRMLCANNFLVKHYITHIYIVLKIVDCYNITVSCVIL